MMGCEWQLEAKCPRGMESSLEICIWPQLSLWQINASNKKESVGVLKQALCPGEGNKRAAAQPGCLQHPGLPLARLASLPIPHIPAPLPFPSPAWWVGWALGSWPYLFPQGKGISWGAHGLSARREGQRLVAQVPSMSGFWPEVTASHAFSMEALPR